MTTAIDITDWPHQVRGHRAVLEAIDAGKRRIVLASPTGMGKTRIVQRLIEDFLAMGKRVVLYSNRKMMVQQLSDALNEAGVNHGVRSPNHDDERHFPFQISSIQTEISRYNKADWRLHDAHLVIVDEAHLNTGDKARTILSAHHEQGAAILGVTATPLDLEDVYEHLIVAGNLSEGRSCGALIPALHFGCDEPDLRAFKKLRESAENVTEGDARKAMMVPGLFGRVLDWFEKLNPQHAPTILFACGVPESIWFAEQFTQAGISAAHIDGNDVWANGRLYKSSQEVRANVLDASKNGKCQVICNRFVLREGVDAPWLAHGIFATIFGVLSSYIQSGGRLLRNHHSLQRVTIQDHGGNWWRWGSLNADRAWFIGATGSMVAGLRADQLRATSSDRKPSRCPKCGMVQVWKSAVCQGCAFECKPGAKVSRPVVQVDGTLKEMSGDIFRPHAVCRHPDGPARWKQMYFRSLQPKANGRSFRAAMALFAYENNWQWPARDWPYMPIDPIDFFKPVRDVPQDTLYQE